MLEKGTVREEEGEGSQQGGRNTAAKEIEVVAIKEGQFWRRTHLQKGVSREGEKKGNLPRTYARTFGSGTRAQVRGNQPGAKPVSW